MNCSRHSTKHEDIICRRVSDDEEDEDDDDDEEEEDDKNVYYGNKQQEEEDMVAFGRFYNARNGNYIPKLLEKSVIIHKDENGFGLRFKGQSPVFVEHVHDNSAAWRAGVRRFDTISKVNGIPVGRFSHKDVILMFKSCARFVALTLLSPAPLEPQQILAKVSCDTNTLDRRPSCVHSSKSASFRNSHQPISSTLLLTRHGSDNNTKDSGNQLNVVTSGNTVLTDIFDVKQPTHRRTESTGGQPKTINLNNPNLNINQSNFSHLASNDSLDMAKFDDDRRLDVCVFCRNSIDIKFEHQPTDTNNSFQREQRLKTHDVVCSSCQQSYSDRLVVSHFATCSNLVVAARSRAVSTSSFRQFQTCRNVGHGYATPPIRTAAGGNLHQDSIRNRFIQQRAQSESTSSLPIESSRPTPQNNIDKEQALSSASGQGTQPMVAQSASSARKRPATINKRLEIIREFIDTEKTHTERLRCLDELFYRPLKAGGLMAPDQLRQVFSCHRTLFKIHRQIYRILLSANCYKLYSEPLIGSALLEIFEGDLKKRLERASCAFCSSQATNIELLNKLTRRDTKCGEFLAHVTSQQMVGRLGIKDLLASCFQRLTKYPLLLENLLKATPQSPSDEDYDDEEEDEEEDEANQMVEADGGVDGAGDDPGGCVHQHSDFDLVSQAEHRSSNANSRRARLNSRRIIAISLAEEREFIERALAQSRQILIRVNEAIKVAVSRHKLKEIWKRTDKYPGVPLIDITKQQVVHEGLLTLRLSKRSFDVYVLLLNDYLIILTREGQDKYRLKFFTPESKSSSSLAGGSQQQSVYSPVFVIDEHLTTRDAATDENGFYLLCKRKDDSRIYEFASRSPAERIRWRDKIQWTIERQMSRNKRRASCESTITKSSSDVSGQRLGTSGGGGGGGGLGGGEIDDTDLETASQPLSSARLVSHHNSVGGSSVRRNDADRESGPSNDSSDTKTPDQGPAKFVGTISYVEDDEIVMPSKMELLKVNVDQAVQVNIPN